MAGQSKPMATIVAWEPTLAKLNYELPTTTTSTTSKTYPYDKCNLAYFCPA